MRLRVLYVVDRWDAPFRYRCLHACRQLRDSGALANIVRVDDPGVADQLVAYSAVVLFRLPWSERVSELVGAARSAGVPILFDCDDLVFDPQAAALMPFRADYPPAEWEALYGRQLRALARTFEACDVFVGSTAVLASHAERRGKRAIVHPNVVPDEYMKLRPRVRRYAHLLRSDPTIGYLAGSDTHDRDFAVVADVLARVLRAHPQVRLLLGGHLRIGPELRGLESRIVRVPYVSFRVLPWIFAACRVTLAPLAVVNEFTDSKSALKFFEPGVFGIPVAATPVAEMRRAVEHGVTGWLCSSEQEWWEALSSALDATTAAAVGRAAARAIEAHHAPQSVAGRLYAQISAYACAPRGPEPRSTGLFFDERLGDRSIVAVTAGAARDARDFARVVSALRAHSEPSPAPEAVDEWIDERLQASLAAGGKSPAIPATSSDGALLLAAGDLRESGWQQSERLGERGAVRGETAVTGETHWFSAEIELGSWSYRYLVVRLRVRATSDRALAHFYWSADGPSQFREEQTASLALRADGVDRTHVVDLWRGPKASAWRRGMASVWLRFDPSDAPASVRVLAMALLPDGWTGTASATCARAAERLPERPAAQPAAFERALKGLSAGELLWLESAQRPQELRALICEAAMSDEAVLERLEQAEGGGSACLIRRVHHAVRPGVDIVVPVYNARRQTLSCLRSVLHHASGDFRLVVIDDASTDPELLPALRRLARAEPRVVLLENEKNLGFVASANRGFSYAAERDVLLLNSDTVVFGGFLRRLQRAAYEDETTGIVCPLSNNATILSVPELGISNELPEGMSARQMAALIARISRHRRPSIVTPHGFCMYIRRAVLDQVGSFDAERFGHGFGEENDFGERAKALGWSVRCADDVYVWHEGKASFGEGGFSLERDNAAVLEARQPGYHAAVAAFVRDNPLGPIQSELRWHLRRKSHALEPAPLFLLHASPFAERPGGTEYVVRDIVRLEGLRRAVLAYSGAGGVGVAEVYDGDLEQAAHHLFPLSLPVPRFCHEHAEVETRLSEIVKLFRIDRVHIHHLMHWPLSIGALLREKRLSYTVTTHDYYCVCPSQNLLDVRRGKLCCPASIGDRKRTTTCLTALHHELGLEPPSDLAQFAAKHRQRFAELFAAADRVVFPSEAACVIVRRAHPILTPEKALVVPHGYQPKGATSALQRRRDGPLRVGLVGEIAYASKGAGAYLEVMEQCRGLELEWHLFGPTDRFDFERRLRSLEARIRVVRHGAYRRDDLVHRLAEAGVDVGLLLSTWPETFSLTLSELLAAGIPVIASRQGALAERLEGEPYGKLVDDPREAIVLIRRLASAPDELKLFQASARAWRAPSPESWLAALKAEDAACAARAAPLPKRGLSAVEARRLYETRRFGVDAVGPATRTTQPAARHASAWWYPWAERLKPWVPESVRAPVRRRLSEDGLEIVRRFRMPGPGVRVGSGVYVDARYVSTARFRATSDDPQLVLELGAVKAASVHAIRFNLWCSHPGDAYARIYWRHAGDRDFDDRKSVTVPLNARSPAWQEYVVRVSDTGRAHEWHAGDELVELRFDPINFRGVFCLGELALCRDAKRIKAADSQRTEASG